MRTSSVSSWKDTPVHVLDFEGSAKTGIVEYGVATLLNGEITSTATRLCAAKSGIPGVDTRCHGIADADLVGSAPVADDWDFFADLRRSGILCAHHAATENSLLKNVWPFPGAMPDHARLAAGDANPPAINDWGPWIDSCRLASVWHPQLADYSLGPLLDYFRLRKQLDALAALHCPPKRSRFHCALFDAIGAALLLARMCDLRAAAGSAPLSLETLVRDGLCGRRFDERVQTELPFDF